jgi:hypothetical protein
VAAGAWSLHGALPCASLNLLTRLRRGTSAKLFRNILKCCCLRCWMSLLLEFALTLCRPFPRGMDLATLPSRCDSVHSAISAIQYVQSPSNWVHYCGKAWFCRGLLCDATPDSLNIQAPKPYVACHDTSPAGMLPGCSSKSQGRISLHHRDTWCIMRCNRSGLCWPQQRN